MSEKLTEIITALVAATDQHESRNTDGVDVEAQVALEALRGLAALLPRLPQETVLQHTPTLLIRIRLFSEKVSDNTYWHNTYLHCKFCRSLLRKFSELHALHTSCKIEFDVVPITVFVRLSYLLDSVNDHKLTRDIFIKFLVFR